jgi:hypothetical protein
MAYRQTVEQHHVLTFSQNIKMRAQTMTNPLMGAVMVEPCSGEAQDIADLIGSVDYQEGEDYGQRNPEIIPERTRRWLVRPADIESGQTITKQEKFDQAMDPTSPLHTAHIKAVMRGQFDRILGVRKIGGAFKISGGGILGDAHEGKTPSGSMPLPGANFISADYGDSGTPYGMGVTKLRAATEAMELEDFGLETDQEIYGLITPKQKTDLLNLAVETGKNLNPFDVKNIAEGKPGKLLGVNWMFSNRLPVDDDGYRLCPLWSKDNIVAGEWEALWANMWNLTEKKNLPYIYVAATLAASRIEDGGVRVLRCAEN